MGYFTFLPRHIDAVVLAILITADGVFEGYFFRYTRIKVSRENINSMTIIRKIVVDKFRQQLGCFIILVRGSNFFNDLFQVSAQRNGTFLYHHWKASG